MIYYAHSMKIYDSSREDKEFKFIKDHFKDNNVVNPNGDIPWKGSMKPYFDAVEASDVVVFSEYQGYVGRGVYEEAIKALEHGIPLRCIRKDENGELIVVNINDFSTGNSGDWAIRYAKAQEEKAKQEK